MKNNGLRRVFHDIPFKNKFFIRKLFFWLYLSNFQEILDFPEKILSTVRAPRKSRFSQYYFLNKKTVGWGWFFRTYLVAVVILIRAAIASLTVYLNIHPANSCNAKGRLRNRCPQKRRLLQDAFCQLLCLPRFPNPILFNCFSHGVLKHPAS